MNLGRGHFNPLHHVLSQDPILPSRTGWRKGKEQESPGMLKFCPASFERDRDRGWAKGSRGLPQRWGAQDRPTALEWNCSAQSPAAFCTWRERLGVGLMARRVWATCIKVMWNVSFLKQLHYSLSPKLRGDPRGRHQCLQVVKSDLEHEPQGRKCFGILSASLQNKFISIPGKLQGRA